MRIFPFFSDFSPIFLQFSFVSSFEHIIQKRSHLRNENIYRSFSIKNAISCGRCYTRGNQFPFSIHFVPCYAIFSCWKSAAINLLRSSNLMSACLPTIPNLIHSYSASTHLEETVPWKSGSFPYFCSLFHCLHDVEASSTRSLFFGEVEIGTRCIFWLFQRGGSGNIHTYIHNTYTHSHNDTSCDRSGVTHSDTTELNSNVPIKPSRARFQLAEIERCNNIFFGVVLRKSYRGIGFVGRVKTMLCFQK